MPRQVGLLLNRINIFCLENKLNQESSIFIRLSGTYHKKMLDEKVEKIILNAQRNEITEHLIYERLAQSIKDLQNKKVLKQISSDELKHYNFWKEFTHKDVKPNRLKSWKYSLISKIFGITFWNKAYGKG
jgi:rubrerythrin